MGWGFLWIAVLLSPVIIAFNAVAEQVKKIFRKLKNTFQWGK